MESLNASFGKILREYRNNAGLSQLELALDCELDRSYISLLERGLKNPSLGTVFSICHVLGIAPSVMISEVEKGIV